MLSSSQRRNRLKHARSRHSKRLRRAAECIQRCWGRFRARCISLRLHPVVTSEKTRRLAYVLEHTGVRDDIYDWYKNPLPPNWCNYEHGGTIIHGHVFWYTNGRRKWCYMCTSAIKYHFIIHNSKQSQAAFWTFLMGTHLRSTSLVRMLNSDILQIIEQFSRVTEEYAETESGTLYRLCSPC